jgi:hypothetical protein
MKGVRLMLKQSANPPVNPNWDLTLVKCAWRIGPDYRKSKFGLTEVYIIERFLSLSFKLFNRLIT